MFQRIYSSAQRSLKLQGGFEVWALALPLTSRVKLGQVTALYLSVGNIMTDCQIMRQEDEALAEQAPGWGGTLQFRPIAALWMYLSASEGTLRALGHGTSTPARVRNSPHSASSMCHCPLNNVDSHQQHCPISSTQAAGSLSSRDNSGEVWGSGVQTLASTSKEVSPSQHAKSCSKKCPWGSVAAGYQHWMFPAHGFQGLFCRDALHYKIIKI